VNGADGIGNIEGKAATGSGEQAGVRASFKLVSRVCEKCGWEIPADAPEGGCPGCLLESGLRLLEQESVAAGKGGSASPKTINAFGLPAEASAQAGERVPPPDNVKRIIFCSGKVYYDLLKYRSDRKIDDAALIRVEQLYPLAEKRLREMLKPFPKGAKLVWCQEEPQNMGAWTFIEPRLRTLFCIEIAYSGREASASPAVGSLARHKREQARLVADAFSL